MLIVYRIVVLLSSFVLGMKLNTRYQWCVTLLTWSYILYSWNNVQDLTTNQHIVYSAACLLWVSAAIFSKTKK